MHHTHYLSISSTCFQISFYFCGMQLQSMGLSFRTAVIRKRYHSGMHRLQVIWFTSSNSILMYIIDLISSCQWKHCSGWSCLMNILRFGIVCEWLSLYDVNQKSCKILFHLRDIKCPLLLMLQIINYYNSCWDVWMFLEIIDYYTLQIFERVLYLKDNHIEMGTQSFLAIKHYLGHFLCLTIFLLLFSSPWPCLKAKFFGLCSTLYYNSITPYLHLLVSVVDRIILDSILCYYHQLVPWVQILIQYPFFCDNSQ